MTAPALIERQAKRLASDFDLYPVVATEIEFYLSGADAVNDMPDFWQHVSEECAAKGVFLYKTDKENGKEQFEVALKPADAVKTANDTVILKEIVTHTAALHRMVADFSAKPFADQPGSGLHFHMHLFDQQGKNVYFKNDSTISPALQNSIGGLLEWLNPCMAVFAPQADSYRRFKPGANAPTTVSWGGNNRTTAIRLPDSAHDSKRIEHRVAGSDADPIRCIAVLIAAMHYGIMYDCYPGQQIFGDASLPMYKLAPIISSLEEAQAKLKDSKLFQHYFTLSDLLPAQ